MPKYWNYDIGDKVEIVKMPAYDAYLLNSTGTIEEYLDSATYDYMVRLANGSKMKFKEEEISKLNNKGDVLVEKENDIEHVLNTLLAHYKNDDGSYTVPEELLKNMLSQIYEVTECQN